MFRIDWNLAHQPQPHLATKTLRWLRQAIASKPVPLHMSSHYHKEHFDPDAPPRLF